MGYEPIEPLPGTAVYPSEVLGLEFRAEGGHLRIRDPETGEDLKGYDEERAGRLAEREGRLAEREGRLAEREARLAAEEARSAAEDEVARLRHLLAKRGTDQA